MKKLILTPFVLFFVLNTHGQNWGLTGHAGMALPIGDAVTYSNSGFSWDVQGEYRIKPQWGLTLQLGGTNWGQGANKYFYDYGSPLLFGRYVGSTDWTYVNNGFNGGIGGKYYISDPMEGLSFFVGLQLNYQYLETTKKMIDQGFVSIGSPNPNTTTYAIRDETTGSTNGVEVRPQMGLLFTTDSHFHISFTAAYGYSTIEWDNNVEVNYTRDFRQTEYPTETVNSQGVYLSVGFGYTFAAE
ncbi:MAG: hypothetical protein SchgKO_11760 [Schleiferiaceae bacterium]